MKKVHQIYISLGSNIGDRMAYLQSAVNAIHERVGEVVALSSVYQTPAWGFESDDFYNACVQIQTTSPAIEVLPVLLKIESDLGRIRQHTEGYRARTVDLDIILSSEGCIQTAVLQVPHPRMQKRKFVLVPLAEIAGAILHPESKVTIDTLVARTTDQSAIHRVSDVLKIPK